MKWLFRLLAVLAFAVLFALFSAQDSGFVVIGRGAWTVETSLSLFILLMVGLGLVGYWLGYLFLTLWRFPNQWWQTRLVQRQVSAQDSLVQSVFAAIQGQWSAAEQHLLKTASFSEVAVLHYLGAAYAAAQQQQMNRSIEYLTEVRQLLPKRELAVLLLQTHLYLQQQRPQAALPSALQAYQLAPKDTYVLTLLVTLYWQLTDWQALLQILPEARKHRALPAEQVYRLESKASIALLHQSFRRTPTQTAKLWENIPKSTRLRPEVVALYVRHLMLSGDATTAEVLLRDVLKYTWNAELVTLYGELQTANTTQQITQAEAWLRSHDNDGALLLTLGHLCLRNRLWDKAKYYLDASLQNTPQPRTYFLLGELAMQQENRVQATEHYRRGLQMLLGSGPIKP